MAPADARDFFEALPPELVPHALSFLSGFDLLPLCCVNKKFHTQWLGADSASWAAHAPREMRVGPYEWRMLATVGWTHVRSFSRFRRSLREPARQRREQRVAQQIEERRARERELLANPKHHYLESVSVCFPGLLDRQDEARTARRWTDARVVLPDEAIDEDVLHHDSFSFDLWMALLPPSATTPSDGSSRTIGGVVFSAQSAHWEDGDAVPPAVAHVVHVDELGGLYCSVAAGAKRVLATLSLSRWYHVALTFDRRSTIPGQAVQRVYLDGECIDTQEGALRLPDQWAEIDTFQLGTGFMEGDAIGLPQVHARRSSSQKGLDWLKGAFRPWRSAGPQFRGNYAFHGLLDDFRLWRGALSAAHVQHLLAGRDHQVSGDGIGCEWSLMTHANYRNFHGDLWAVECTRPTERECEGVAKAFRLWSVDEL